MNISQGEDFSGHSFAIANQYLQEFWTPFIQGTKETRPQWGQCGWRICKNWWHKTRTTKGSGQNLNARFSGKRKQVCQHLWSLLWKMPDTKIRSVTLKYRADTSIFFWKANVLDNTPCKTKIPNNGHIPTMAEGEGEPYGIRKRRVNQPQEGTRWQM